MKNISEPVVLLEINRGENEMTAEDANQRIEREHAYR